MQCAKNPKGKECVQAYGYNQSIVADSYKATRWTVKVDSEGEEDSQPYEEEMSEAAEVERALSKDRNNEKCSINVTHAVGGTYKKLFYPDRMALCNAVFDPPTCALKMSIKLTFCNTCWYITSQSMHCRVSIHCN